MNVNWRPYIAGALAGLLAVASVVVSTKMLEKPKYLGASTTFVRAAGLAEQAVVPDHVAENDYYVKTRVKVDWQMMFVAGVLLGAFVASLFGGGFKLEMCPPIWSDRFGRNLVVRGVGAFIGGALLLFGARLAGGCPSGHGLSGLMQLSVSGYVAMAGFFGGGVVAANMLYWKGTRDE